jgi:hypothetical protein
MPTKPRKLKDIDIDEISLVDAGANRKKFYLIKRSQAMDELLAILKSYGLDPAEDKTEIRKSLNPESLAALKNALTTLASFKDEYPEDIIYALKNLAAVAAYQTFGKSAEGIQEPPAEEEDVSLEKVGAKISKLTKEELAKLSNLLGDLMGENGLAKARAIINELMEGKTETKKAEAPAAPVQPAEAPAPVKKIDAGNIEVKITPGSELSAILDGFKTKIEKLEGKLAKYEKAAPVRKGLDGPEGETEEEPASAPIEKKDKWPSLTKAARAAAGEEEAE